MREEEFVADCIRTFDNEWKLHDPFRLETDSMDESDFPWFQLPLYWTIINESSI
jgi:hypothetical protein